MPTNLKRIDLEAVLQWIRDNSIDGYAPARNLYHRAAAVHGLPSYSALQLRRWTWPKLAAAAGVEPCPKGRKPIHGGSQFLRAHPGAVPPSLAEELERMEAAAEPPRPTDWPLCGIPTRTETFVVAITGDTAVRCTRSYYSLR